jgi:hypothetical protein
MRWPARRRRSEPVPAPAPGPPRSPVRRPEAKLWGARASLPSAPLAPAPTLAPDHAALGYVRLEHADRAELAAHVATLERLCSARRMRLAEVICEIDGEHAGAGLAWALGRLAVGEAVVVPGLDHLDAAFAEREQALAWFRERGGLLLAPDIRSDAPVKADRSAREKPAPARGVPAAELLGVDARAWALAAAGGFDAQSMPLRKRG